MRETRRAVSCQVQLQLPGSRKDVRNVNNLLAARNPLRCINQSPRVDVRATEVLENFIALPNEHHVPTVLLLLPAAEERVRSACPTAARVSNAFSFLQPPTRLLPQGMPRGEPSPCVHHRHAQKVKKRNAPQVGKETAACSDSKGHAHTHTLEPLTLASGMWETGSKHNSRSWQQ